MEEDFIAALRRQAVPCPELILGIGDDAAVLRTESG